MNQTTNNLSSNSLFDHAPTALIEFDLTGLFAIIDLYKEKNIQDLSVFFNSNPIEWDECLKTFQIANVNLAAQSLFEIEILKEIREDFTQFFTAKTHATFRLFVSYLFEGKNEFVANSEIFVKSRHIKRLKFKINHFKDPASQQVRAIQSLENSIETSEIEFQLHKTLSLSPDSVTISRISDGVFVFVNEKFKKASGYTDQEIIEKSGYKLNMWVFEEERNQYLTLLKEQGFIKDFPATFRMKNGHLIETLLSCETIQYRGEAHYITSSKDITKLNQITRDLRKSEEQFRNAFMNIPDAVQINRVSDARFIDFNEYFLKYTGYSREDLIGKTPDELGIWIESENSKTYYKRLKRNGFVDNLEISFRTKEGKPLHALLSSNIIEIHGEAHIITISRNITELKVAHEKLKQSEEQFRIAFNSNPDPQHIIDIATDTFVDINDGLVEFSGYSREEILGKKSEDLNLWANPDDKNKVRLIMKEKGKVDNFEAGFRMKDGRILYGLFSTRIVHIFGKPHFLSLIKDITQIKKTQDALVASEEKFQNIFSKNPDALAIMEMTNWTFADVNEMFVNITQFSREEIIGKTAFDLRLWSNQSDRDFFTRKMQRKEEINNHETLFFLPNGQKIHMLISAKLIEISGQTYFLLIAKNINDFVAIQKELFEKDNQYKTIVNNSNEGITIVDDQFKIEYANRKLEQITGYTENELIGRDFRIMLTSESAVLVGERYIARQAGKEVQQNYTFEVVQRTGEIRTVEIHSSILKIKDKIKTMAQLLDVTDQLKAEKRIAKEHQRAVQYFEVAGMMMMALDTNGVITAINKKGCEILEAEENLILGKNWFADFLPKKTSTQLLDQFLQSIQNGSLSIPLSENTIKTLGGNEKLISWHNSLLRDENDLIIGTISSGEDITNKEEASRILNLSGLVAILWKNEEGWPIQFVSNNAEKLFGYRSNDFYNGTVSYHQLVHPDDLERVNSEVSAFAQEERSSYTHQPYRIITKDQKIVWISDHTTVQYNSDGDIAFYYGVLSDITSEVARSEKLRQAYEILSQMNDGVITVDFLGTITSWTGDAEKIFGYQKMEILHQNINLIWGNTPEEAELLLATIVDEIDIYGYYQHEIICTQKNNEKIPIELTGKILYDSAGIPLHLIFVCRDIRNRKIAQKAIESSEKRYRHIFESILDAVVIYNLEGEIVQVNRMATRMYEYSYTEFTQTTISRFIQPVQNHSFDEVIAHLNNNYERMFEGESVDVSKSGKKFFVNAKGRLIDYNDKPHLLIIIRDITKVKQAEHDLRKAKEKAIESEQLKSAFLANMSHEIRTPMNSIIGFADLLGEEDISADEKNHFLTIIRQNGNQLLNIINDIIDISKIEAGQIALNYERVNLAETFTSLFNMFEIPAKNKGLRLVKKFDFPTADFYFISDEFRLKQILINLINNALKFTHHGYIEFGSRLSDNEKSILFYVSDTGIGISKSKQEAIFQRFMQAELKTTKLYGGTGLGLAISQGLVQAFKGKIWLESDEGMGSTFKFSLPLVLK